MAAVISTRVWVFGVGDFAALTAAQLTQVKNSKIKIKMIYWSVPSTAVPNTDLFSITDADGNLIQDGKCEVAGQSQIFNKDNWFNGIGGITLTTGTLEINIL